MKKQMKIISKYIIVVFLFLIIINFQIFAKNREYGDLYYEIDVPNTEYFDYNGVSENNTSRVIIDKKGNKILDLLFHEDMVVLKDLYTDEPKLLIKYSSDRELFRISDSHKYNKNYNPIYSYDTENIIERVAPYWWNHEDIYKSIGYDAIDGTKINVYDLNGNDLNIEIQTRKSLYDAIWVFQDFVLYVNLDLTGNEMYCYNLSTKEKKLIGNYEKIDKLDDMYVAYKTNVGPSFSNNSQVGFFTKNMELIKEFSGYEKIDYVKINDKNYYVLTYNKLVINKTKGDMLGQFYDYYNRDNYRRYANFVDSDLNFVFGKDIFIDYERIENEFDYEKVFNDNINNENTIFGPHNTMIDINEINLVIELKNETIYMINDEKGYAICDENRNIIGHYFDKPIYIHNIADEKEKLIFSYALDDVSYFINHGSDEDSEDLYYDNLDLDALNKYNENYEYKIYETNILRQYFYIKDNKVENLKNIDDMVLVALNIDGFYFYHKIYGNNGFTYLRKNRNDLSIYEDKIYDLDGNVYNLNEKVGLSYSTKIYKINNKYYIIPMSTLAVYLDPEYCVYDLYGNEALDEGHYIIVDGNLIRNENNKTLYLYDENFKKNKEIDIKESNVEIRHNFIVLYNRYSKIDKVVYDKNFNIVSNINSLPYNFLNLKQSNKSNVMSNENKLLQNNEIEFKIEEYSILKNDDNKYFLRDHVNKKNILRNYKYLSFFNEKYIYYQYGFKYGLMDYNGNKFCEFSIFDTISDD